MGTKAQQIDLFKGETQPTASAVFSNDRVYRYVLFRSWGPDGQTIAFIGLNPSTADETKNDPTVSRCINYAKRWGFQSMHMLNIFAFRATDPKAMLRATDPVGDCNDEWIENVCKDAHMIVLCWGQHGHYLDRGKEVMESLRKLGKPLHYLKACKNGMPGHPLYLPADLKPKPYIVESQL